MRTLTRRIRRAAAAAVLAGSLIALPQAARADSCEQTLHAIPFFCINGPGIHYYGDPLIGATYFFNINGNCGLFWFTTRCDVLIEVRFD